MRASRFAATTRAIVGSAIAGSVAAGCGIPAARRASAGPPRAADAPVSQSRVLTLASSGAVPHDTVVTFRAGTAYTIVLPHPSDRTVFAEVAFAPATFAADSGRDIRVQLRPHPGIYGLDIETSAPIGKDATVTFKYSRYFFAPPGTRGVYGSDVALERALAVAQLRSDSLLVFLPSTRPAADNLQTPLPKAGTYLVAAPR